MGKPITIGEPTGSGTEVDPRSHGSPTGPQPSFKRPLIGRAAAGGEAAGLIRLPTISAIDARKPDTRGRLFWEEAIVAEIGDGEDGRLVRCMLHNGQDVTPMNLFAYDPKTGMGICTSCKKFVEETKGFLPGMEKKVEELERR